MKIPGWRYYSGAAIPTSAPNAEPDMEPLTSGEIWGLEGGPLFARWTGDFDCGYETSWWYVVKDTVFDIDALKAKRRYEITKGKKYFEVRAIDPSEHCDALFRVQSKAYEQYPASYRPVCSRETFEKGIDGWMSDKVYGAFFKETGELCGYSILRRKNDNWLDFMVQKTDPDHERYGVNAALVEGLLNDNRDFLARGGFICDGARSINHETAFQDYLEKYFGFRKAYCKLHMQYNPRIAPLIKVLYPLRRLLTVFDKITIIHKINLVLKMEEIARKQNEK